MRTVSRRGLLAAGVVAAAGVGAVAVGSVVAVAASGAALWRTVADALPGAERDFGAGFHHGATWRSRVPRQLDFFERNLRG